jgi:thiol-disulfide isomerase/thioredoxin
LNEPVRRLVIIVIATVSLVSGCTDSTSGETVPSAAEAGTGVDEGSAPSSTIVESFAGDRPAPEFPAGLDWLNVEAPLTLAALRGKVVLLDFWTYGCINCIHILPELQRLEAEFAEELVVIGVHSAKFANEGDTGNIRQVVLRYGIEHPVVNDAGFQVWNAWGTTAWPTTVLVDPAGNVVGGHSGEGVYDVAQPVIASLVAEFDARGELDRAPVEVALEAEAQPDRALTFPGKVLAEPGGERLFIADTGRNRIVVADRGSGRVTAVYGSGRPGLDDGPATTATFAAPQGMALGDDGATLYVADTNNHAIRAVDTTTGRVTTVLGTGERGYPPEAGTGRDVAIASPWDVLLDGDTLYIAMAGTHQIWSLDLESSAATPVVGSSVEGVGNGPLLEAELAQPSGMARIGDTLYFADAESSSIRSASIAGTGAVTALVAGASSSLFDFGAIDGVGDEARFQHPLGIAAVDEDTLLVADTYNSLIRRVTPATGLTTTYLGDEAGWRDGDEPRFDEPGGISVDGDTAFVADTNNHAIRVIDLATGSTSTLLLQGIEAFEPPPGAEGYRGTVIPVAPVTVGVGPGTLLLDIGLPDGYVVNDEAPSSLVLAPGGPATIRGANIRGDSDGVSFDLTGRRLPVRVPVRFTAPGDLVADLTLVYCEAKTPELCLIEMARFEVPVRRGGRNAASEVVLAHQVVLPDPADAGGG